MEKLNFKIKGMDCRACAVLIEEELKDFSGVESVSVDYDSGRALVVYNEQITNQEKIFKQVEGLGKYKAVFQ